MLSRESFGPCSTVGAVHAGLSALGEACKPAKMVTAYRHILAASFQPLQAVLADRLEHPEAGLAVGVTLWSDKTLGDERFQEVEDIDAEIAKIADGLGGV